MASKQKTEVALWLKRVKAGEAVRETWEKEYMVAESYQYWKGRQRDEPYDGPDRKAQHNKVHPDVGKQIASLYFNYPFGRIVASPERADTPRETISAKARLLQDTGIFLVRNKQSGFSDNTTLALKEAQWAIGAVEVGYSPDFIENPLADRPALKEKEDTELLAVPVRDEFGLTPDEGSDLPSLKKELKRLQKSLRGETFYVKHLTSKQLIESPSDCPITENNDWLGYWEEHAIEDVKKSTAYKHTSDLKPQGEHAANDGVDKVKLYKIWDLRAMVRMVFAEGHDFFLLREPFERYPIKYLRLDVDPYHFRPVPFVFLKIPSQDSYNDSAEYLRKMRISTVPRYTYDEDAITPEEAAKFQSRDMNIMIPRKGGTQSPIVPVEQSNTSEGAIRTLALSEKEFAEAGSSAGDPLSPPTQTATRAVIANAEQSAQDGMLRNITAKWLASIIEELIILAVEKMNLAQWIAANVDLDSPMALGAIVEVAQTYQQISSEKLRDATMGIKWHVEVEAESLSPVSQAEQGMKLMQAVKFISDAPIAAIMSKAPGLLKRMMSYGGIKTGEDLDAIKEALGVIVQMNMNAASAGSPMPGASPMAGSAPNPPPVSGKPTTETSLPVPPGAAGA